MKKLFGVLLLVMVVIVIILVFKGSLFSQSNDLKTNQFPVKNSVEKGTESLIKIPGLKVENGILVFNTLEDFTKGYEILNSMDLEKSLEWEKELKFESQRNIFAAVVNAEYNIFLRPYENLNEEQLKKLTPPKVHSDKFKEALSTGVIKLIISEDKSDTTYNYSIFNGGYSSIINKRGIFVIGDTVYQVTQNLLKEVTGYNKKNLNLISNLDTADNAKGINVINLSRGSVPAYSTSGWRYSSNGKKRGQTTIYYSNVFYNPYPYTKANVNYGINVQAQTKNFWGNWNYDGGECWISGTWTYKTDLINISNLGYCCANNYPRNYSYPFHPNSINNLWISLSPVTGISAIYPTTYVLTAPTAKAFSSLYFSAIQWNVSVPGGSSGISCNCP